MNGDRRTKSVFLITSSNPTLDRHKPCGTGFCIHKDNQGIYVVTCAHVLEDMGGKDFVCVNNKPATLVSETDIAIDLVVLRLEGLEDSIPFEIATSSNSGQDIQLHGFAALKNNGYHALRTLDGTLGDSIFQSYNQGEISVESWDLVINNSSQHIQKKLRGGYSGSPVVDLDNKVIGVVSSQLNTEGSLGVAISAVAISRVWPEMPYALQTWMKENRPTTVNRINAINFSKIISRLSNKFRQAPENVTDPDWILWFREMFALQHRTLEEISFSIGSLLGAHRTTVYFLNTFGNQTAEKSSDYNELWSLLAQGEESLEIRVPVGEGVSGTVAATEKTIFIPYDAYEKAGELKHTIISQDNKTGYRTYSLLTTPFFGGDGKLIAVFQFLNKLKLCTKNSHQLSPNTHIVKDSIDTAGFSLKDKEIFDSHIPEIRLIIELYQDYFRQFKKLQSIVNFSSATLKLNREGQDLEDILKQVVNEARKITNADRGTFWLLDSQGKSLKAKVPIEGGGWREIRIKIGEGFAGGVAKARKTLNIPFDLYNHPASAKSKETDITTGYRTCSLLCMPVFSRDGLQVIGVTQLLNKRTQQSIEEKYQASNYSDGIVPDFFRASFTPEDELRLSRFNDQVAAAIESSQQPIMVEQYKNLYQLLQVTSQLAGKYLNVHRTQIFFVDEDSSEVWSIIAGKDNSPFEISVPFGYGDLGEVAISKKPKIVSDINQEFLEPASKDIGSNPGYCIYNKLLFPLFPKRHSKKLLAIIEFANKLKIGFNQNSPFSVNSLDESGFNEDDIARFDYNHVGSIVHLVNGFLDAYQPVYQYREGEKLRKAKEFVIKSGASSTEALDKMMVAARELVGAHRSTLWRIDPDDREILYAFIPSSEGVNQRITATIGEGYVGQAAATAIEILSDLKSENRNHEDIKTYQFLNIEFDLYNDRPRSDKARETDKQTKYRTCSLLCIPILSPEGELLGVIQLLNKLRRGFEGKAQDIYHIKDPPPECFMASFNKQDERQMADFCSAVGYVLKLLEVRQEVLSQRKIKEFQDRIDRINQQTISSSI